MLFKNIAHVGSFKHFVFVYLRICVIVYLCILHLIHGNVIFDILESYAFQKYSTCWVKMRAKMFNIDVLCPLEVVGNNLELLGASSGALCNFFQWMGKLDPLQAPPKREVFRQIFDFA